MLKDQIDFAITKLVDVQCSTSSKHLYAALEIE